MEISTATRGKTLVVTVVGRLDAVTAPTFETKMAALIHDGHRRFAVDLAALNYLSSAGLRALLIAARQVAPLGGTIVLCRPTEHVSEVLRVSAFSTLFEVLSDLNVE